MECVSLCLGARTMRATGTVHVPQEVTNANVQTLTVIQLSAQKTHPRTHNMPRSGGRGGFQKTSTGGAWQNNRSDGSAAWYLTAAREAAEGDGSWLRQKQKTPEDTTPKGD
jgi:hypothetical protein